MIQEGASLAPRTGSIADRAEAASPDGSPAMALVWLASSLVLIALAALAFCALAGMVAVGVLYLRDGLDGLIDFYQELRFDLPLKTQIGAAFVSILYVGIAIATLAVAAWSGRASWARRVALVRSRWQRPAAITIFTATLIYAASATLTMSLLRGSHVIISGPTDVVLLATISANLVVLAPLAEEILFRGWLYTGLRTRFSFWPSFLVTAPLFAAIHWDASHRRIFLVLPLAVALGVLREVTGSIKPTIALHGLYNLIIVAITLWEVG